MITNEMIQAFLCVVEYGNFTLAAENTYTTQSNISKQIKNLEQELDVSLFLRSKGNPNAELTGFGRHFLTLAHQWESLQDEFNDVKYFSQITEISIGALDRFNTFTFQNYYLDILENHPEIRLDVHTRHSKEIYSRMNSHQFDLGYVSSLYPVNDITVTPLYEESMYIITAKNSGLGEVISPDQLDPAKEVYSRWSDEFDLWHDHIWPHKQYRIHVGTSSMTPYYILNNNCWSIVPISILNAFMSIDRFELHRLSTDIPTRIIYQLEHKHLPENKKKAITAFTFGLKKFLINDPYLTSMNTIFKYNIDK